MFTSKNNFHLVYPSQKSYRLIMDCEKARLVENLKRDNINLYSISVNDWHCKMLSAKEGDIIGIKDHIANIYRKVIA